MKGPFDEAALPGLRRAVGELSWLLGRGYPETASLKLVGDRHHLLRIQRSAVRRSSGAGEALAARRAGRVAAGAVAGARLAIDGFNVLTTVETAARGDVVLAGLDGCWRDLASAHGLFDRLETSPAALDAVVRTLDRLGPADVVWLLDRPVSRSGRLRQRLEARREGRPWTVELVDDPDPVLIDEEDGIVATADGAILERCRRWFDLARAVVEAGFPSARIVDLAGG